MNDDKTLKDYPIWYYKELKEVDTDYVICYLLKQTFVVEIKGSKHEITFIKNKKNEIGQYILYDDVQNSNLCSFEVIQDGFEKGIWYIITDIDTTEEFKKKYRKRKESYKREEVKQFYKDTLNSIIEDNVELSQRDNYFEQIENASYEELEELIKCLTKSK